MCVVSLGNRDLLNEEYKGISWLTLQGWTLEAMKGCSRLYNQSSNDIVIMYGGLYAAVTARYSHTTTLLTGLLSNKYFINSV